MPDGCAIVLDHSDSQKVRDHRCRSPRCFSIYECALPIFLAPIEHQVRIHVVPTRHDRHRRSRHKCFFHNPALLMDGQPPYTPCSLRLTVFSARKPRSITVRHMQLCPCFRQWTVSHLDYLEKAARTIRLLVYTDSPKRKGLSRRGRNCTRTTRRGKEWNAMQVGRVLGQAVQ